MDSQASWAAQKPYKSGMTIQRGSNQDEASFYMQDDGEDCKKASRIRLETSIESASKESEKRLYTLNCSLDRYD
jgi:hypothetical protein